MNEHNNETEPALKLVDIGANLASSAFQRDLPQVLERARAAGVTQLVVTGTSVAQSRAAQLLTVQYPNTLYSTAGIHPHDAADCTNDSLLVLRELAAKPAVKAIGECGLDFNRNIASEQQQITAFEVQIELAIELKMPLFLHERDAFKTQRDILAHYRDDLDDIVIHCFTGEKHQAFSYLDIDCHIGITGWICDPRRGYHLHDFVGDIPLNRLMIESDAPYLLPRVTPKLKLEKSGRNEPCTLPHVLKSIADHSGRSMGEVATQTRRNAINFFRLNQPTE